jgi:hypothetical protein
VRSETRKSIGFFFAVLVAVSCSSSSTPHDAATDLALAERAVLNLDDLPPGFTAVAHDPARDLAEPVKRRFAACLKTSPSIFDDATGAQRAHSDDFNDGANTLTNEVELQPTEGQLDAGFGQLAKPATMKCLGQLLTASFGPDASVVPAAATRFEVRGVGDRSIGFEVKTTVTTGSTSRPGYVDVLLGQRKRALVTLTATGFGVPYDRNTEISLLSSVFERIRSQAD